MKTIKTIAQNPGIGKPVSIHGESFVFSVPETKRDCAQRHNPAILFESQTYSEKPSQLSYSDPTSSALGLLSDALIVSV